MPLTGKAFAYLATAYVFIFLTFALRTNWLTLFALPIAILLFASSKFPKTNPTPLSITRQIRPIRSIVGEHVSIILTITNTSPHNLQSFLLEDKIPDELKLHNGTNRMVLSLRTGENATFEYQLSSPKRGTYSIGPSSVHVSDSLGLRTAEIPFHNIDELIVLPRIEKLGLVDLKGRRFGPWPGLVPSRRIGVGTEFFELAPYVAGVDLRRVNWKASARSGSLITNEFEGEHVIDVLVVLDCSEAATSALFDYDVLEFQVSFAASLCSQLIQQGNRVGLSVYGAVRTWVSPAFGKRQLLRLLDSLASVRPGQASLPIAYVVESIVTTILPTRSLVLLISPMLGTEVVDTIERIAVRGYNIVCFTPSTRASHVEVDESSDIARRILNAERKLGISKVRRIANVIQLSPQQAIRPLLRARARWSTA